MSSRESICPHGQDLSALLDGELTASQAAVVEEHLAHCPQCAREFNALGRVRRAVRAQPVGEVPDLVGSIVERLHDETVRSARRREWNVRARVASTAAVAAAILLAGVSFLGGDDPPQLALASQIAEDVRARARTLDAYRATYSIVERGFHKRVDERRFSAEVLFDAPESYRLTIADNTTYPNHAWPSNDVELIAGPHRWWIKEPSSCPPESLPGCDGSGSTIEQRSHIERLPFDGTIGLPTDLILPLKTLADSPSFRVDGRSEVAGRSAIEISLPYRQAVPLVASLQEGGLWRSFYPSDPVDLWIDESTGFPLQFRVRAGDSAERRIWAERLRYDDQPGGVLLDVRANDFSEPRGFAPRTFAAPSQGISSSGRFSGTSFGSVADELRPADVAGLEPFRAGTTEDGQEVLTYAEGMAWLKIVGTSPPERFTTAQLLSEEIRLANGTWAYYLPATTRQGRSLEMFGDGSRLLLETNLRRATALRIAASIDFDGRRLDGGISNRSRFAPERVSPEDLEELAFVRSPTYLPPRYTARAAYTSRTTTGMSATTYYRGPESEYDGLGIRITEERGVDFLLPTAEESVNLKVGSLELRWFPERGEVEWLEGDVHTSIAAPSFPRSTLLRIAQGLR